MTKVKKEPTVAKSAPNETTKKVVEQETLVTKSSTDVTAKKEGNDAEIVIFPETEKVEETKTRKFDKESKSLFVEYPDKDAFHFTSDGLAFFQHTDARNHASTLDDKEVISKTRK